RTSSSLMTPLTPSAVQCRIALSRVASGRLMFWPEASSIGRPGVSVLSNFCTLRRVIMSTLLHLDARPRNDRSHSRRLSAFFVQQWLERHPGDTVLYRDLRVFTPAARHRGLDRCGLLAPRPAFAADAAGAPAQRPAHRRVHLGGRVCVRHPDVE